MSPRFRQATYWIFLLGFFITAPLVVLYTAGYRVNLRTGRVSQTGLLSIGTVPKGATIYIDGEKQEQKTPAVLKNLLPGEHRVRLERAGYSGWQKTLLVESRQTTFATEIALFLEGAPSLITSGTLIAKSTHPETGEAAFAIHSGEWVEVWVLNEAGEEGLVARLPFIASSNLSLDWSTNGSYIGVQTMEHDVYVKNLIEITTGKSVSVTSLVPNAISGVWDAGSGSRFFARSSDGLFSIDPVRETVLLVSKEAETARTDKEDLLAIIPSGDRRVLARVPEEGPSEILAYLPFGTYQFHPSPDGLALLEDNVRDRIILVDLTEQKKPILLNTEAHLWQWHPEKPRLLYSNGFDLHAYNGTTHTDDTVTRVSEPFTGIAWYPDASAVLYTQSMGLYGMELDYRDGRNVTTLTEGTDLSGLWLDISGERAYFFGTIGETEGVWERELQK